MKWDENKIGEVFKVTSGGTPSRKKPEYFNGGHIPWVKTGDLKNRYVKEPEEKITTEGLNNSSAKLFPKGTVLLAMYGATIGACSILPFEASTNQACAALLPSPKCTTDYLYYFLKSIKRELINKGVGGAQPNISGSIIKGTKIPLPPLPIQKKIAAILDAADAYRQKTKALIEKYDELTQSLFLEMFGDPVRNEKGWEVQKLKKLTTKIQDGTHFSPGLVEKGIPYVTARHVKKNGLDFFSKPTYVTEEAHKKIYKRCNVKKGDVIYIKDGATTGIAAINEYDFEFSMLSSIAFLRVNNNHLSNYYLCHLLNHENFKENLIRKKMSGAAIKRFTNSKINDFDIPTPPLELQQKFASVALEFRNQMKQAELSFTKSEELFQSLLQRAFKGELVN